MYRATCTTCGKFVNVPETNEEIWVDPRSTEYFFVEKNGSKRAYCDANCSLKDHIIFNSETAL